MDLSSFDRTGLPARVGTWLPRLRQFHRVSALLIGLFILVHLANHVGGLFGEARHIAFMRALRPWYRNAVVEPLLLTLFAGQLVTGLAMAIKGWTTRRGRVAWLQAGSGLYLAFFLAAHTISILVGRSVLHLDTDFRFAAAGLHVPGWPFFFAPYYALAVTALFVHLACALYWRLRPRGQAQATRMLTIGSMVGLGLGVLIVAALAGWLYPVQLPEPYLRTFAAAP